MMIRTEGRELRVEGRRRGRRRGVAPTAFPTPSMTSSRLIAASHCSSKLGQIRTAVMSSTTSSFDCHLIFAFATSFSTAVCA